MYYLITVIAMDADGPLGRPVVEQICPDDVWADNTGERLGLIVKSLAVAALIDEPSFGSRMRGPLGKDDAS